MQCEVSLPISTGVCDVIADIADAWIAVEIPHSVQCLHSSGHHVSVAANAMHRKQIICIALKMLRKLGWHACCEQVGTQHRILGFRMHDESFSAIRIDIISEERPIVRRVVDGFARLVPRLAPRIALVGPDGVGKSTAIRQVQDWFEREAPFISLTVRQWRPWLLPSLSSLFGRGESTNPDPEPRRMPGKFHFVRLGYYYLDFVLGSFQKDRRRVSEPRIVLYDRCAIDMAVDPVRFALKSARATRLMALFSPKPFPVIFLTDDAARIYSRKRHLKEQEIREQLNTWHELANKGQVHAVVQVGGPPAEVARSVLDLIVQAFLRVDESYSNDSADGPERLEWIGRISSGRIGLRHSWSQYKSIQKQVFSAGTQNGNFLVLPSAAKPRLLIPDGTRKVMSASLRLYNPQRPLARFARGLLDVGLRTGLAKPILRRLFFARVAADASGAPEADPGPLFSHLDSVIGTGPMSYSVALGTPSPHRKPVLHIATPRGETVGYAKVGWNKPSKRLVRNEAEMLRRLENIHFEEAMLPRVLYLGAWRDLDLLVQSSLSEVGNSPGVLTDGHIRFLLQLYRLMPTTGELLLPEKGAIDAVLGRGFSYYSHIIRRGVTFCRERVGNAKLPFAPLHGDFTPWNMRSFPGGLLICDWEYSRLSAPAGWDLFHFLISADVLLRKWSARQIYRRMESGTSRELVLRYLREVGIPEELLAPLVVSYLASALTDDLLLHGVETTRDDQATREAWAALLNLVTYMNRVKPMVVV